MAGTESHPTGPGFEAGPGVGALGAPAAAMQANNKKQAKRFFMFYERWTCLNRKEGSWGFSNDSRPPVLHFRQSANGSDVSNPSLAASVGGFPGFADGKMRDQPLAIYQAVSLAQASPHSCFKIGGGGTEFQLDIHLHYLVLVLLQLSADLCFF
jgi:hypothetical protein